MLGAFHLGGVSSLAGAGASFLLRREGDVMRVWLYLTHHVATVGITCSTIHGVVVVQKIIDTHFHIWDRKLLQLDWLAGFPALDRDFTYKEYIAATAGFEIEQAVYVEVNVAATDRQKEVRLITELCVDPKTIIAAMVAEIDLRDEGTEQVLNDYVANPWVKAVRCVFWPDAYPDELQLSTLLQQNLDQVGQSHLPFEVCIRPSQLESIVGLVKNHPGATFVLEHACGLFLPEEGDIAWAWYQAIDALAACDNAVMKFSGLINVEQLTEHQFGLLAAAFTFCWQRFGAERMLYGSNWPVSTLSVSYGQWVSALHHCLRENTRAERDAFFRGNAVKVYDLATID